MTVGEYLKRGYTKAIKYVHEDYSDVLVDELELLAEEKVYRLELDSLPKNPDADVNFGYVMCVVPDSAWDD